MRARRRCVEIDTSKGLPAKKEEGLRIRSESFLFVFEEGVRVEHPARFERNSRSAQIEPCAALG